MDVPKRRELYMLLKVLLVNERVNVLGMILEKKILKIIRCLY